MSTTQSMFWFELRSFSKYHACVCVSGTGKQMRGSRCLQPCRSSCPGYNNSSASFWLMPQSFQSSFRNRSWRSSMLLYRCVCVCACVSFFSDQMFSYAKKPETVKLWFLMSKHVVGVVDTCSFKLICFLQLSYAEVTECDRGQTEC